MMTRRWLVTAWRADLSIRDAAAASAHIFHLKFLAAASKQIIIGDQDQAFISTLRVISTPCEWSPGCARRYRESLRGHAPSLERASSDCPPDGAAKKEVSGHQSHAPGNLKVTTQLQTTFSDTAPRAAPFTNMTSASLGADVGCHRGRFSSRGD